jgi:hypothetical protein
MKAKLILKPYQKELIEKKLKEAKQKRLTKAIVFDKNISAKNKLAMIRTILKQK